MSKSLWTATVHPAVILFPRILLLLLVPLQFAFKGRSQRSQRNPAVALVPISIKAKMSHSRTMVLILAAHSTHPRGINDIFGVAMVAYTEAETRES